ncbi:mRNA-degrading endonuclease RelE of RelBE toxin-antitoxin system [Agromyces terreus]|uniref:mRNA-degrading endonuclease RelE of RelBE toxin-antitoxin system n=1 Tax=Agromyces terreus TaxID=424795 RepID=A0A9X2GYY6_9MICO|nr:type II toxin-antitoxin system RelE/ParE family toxin [Agromyces terreus]MCP2369991.1 mRNA-degrading endonuclease RelE of RelBE toxin-antitoxin system [Agromyces terreus]
MIWHVRFADPALRSLDRLPLKIAQAVVEFSTVTLPENPHRMSKPLQREFEGLRSARRGEYRVLFMLDDETGTLLVMRVAHRRDAYRLPPP